MLGLIAAWRRNDESANLQALPEVIQELAPFEARLGSSLAPDEHPSAKI
jgi:hypothetical protein